LSHILLHLLDLLLISLVLLLFSGDLSLEGSDLSGVLGSADFELDVSLLLLEDLLLGLDLLLEGQLELTLDLVLEALEELGLVLVQQCEGIASGEGNDIVGGLELVFLVVFWTLGNGYAR
jgi:hypothetical protein